MLIAAISAGGAVTALSARENQNEFLTTDLLPELENIRCPTLVLSGELDPITPIADSEDITAAIPQAELRVFEGAGHGVFRDQPEEAVAVIREFVLK